MLPYRISAMEHHITSLPPVPGDRRIAYGDGPSQFFDVWTPREEIRGTAVMIHGGFWRARYDLTHASHMCAALAASGIATASLEYRRVGETGGGWPGSYQDARAGFAAAREYLGPAPILLGHSAGGHLALRLAADEKTLRGVVALAPVANLRLAFELNLSNGAVRDFLGATPREDSALYDAACPTKHATQVPVVLVHGTSDDVVPIELSNSYRAARRQDVAGVRIVELLGVDHFALIDPESLAWPIVLNCVLEMSSVG